MGAVISYWKSGGGHAFDAAERREGGKRLGAMLRPIPGDDPRDEIYEVLQNVLADNDFKLRYEYKDDGGNPQTLVVEEVETQGGDKIVLELDKVMGVDSDLVMTVSSDYRERQRKNNNDVRKRVYHMAVRMPERDEIDAFNYLDGISQDVIEINNVSGGGDYLTAFKLLSRCR